MSRSGPGGPGAVSGARGVGVSLGSSVLFGVIYFLTPSLAPMSGEAVWAVRVIVTLPFVTFILFASRDWRLVTEFFSRIRRQPLLALGAVVSALLLATQLWLFSWAPLNGRGVQVALGFFLLPLVLVLVGRFLYQDQMTWWQWVAAGVAGIGVAHEIWRVGGIGWETLTVALIYPAYFVLRRAMGTGHLGGMWWDLALVAPIAIALAAWSFADGSWLAANPTLWWAAPSVALLAALALLLYLLASRLLSMSVFGLLSYVEPALLLIAALLIGERIAEGELFTYAAIWAAVLILVIGGAVDVVRQLRRRG